VTRLRFVLSWLTAFAFAVALFAFPSTAIGTPQFLSPANVSDAGQDGFEPQVAVDGSGNVVAVWTRSDGTNFRIQSANRTPNGAWSAAQTISDPGQPASTPRVAVDPAGNALAVWTRFDGSKLRVQAAYRPAGGSFAAPVTVSAAGQDATAPAVSMDASGKGIVAWQRFDGSVTTAPQCCLRVQAAIRSTGAGGTFAAVTTLSEAGRDAFEPQVSAGPDVDANAAICWTRSDGVNLRVQCSRRRDVQGYVRPKGATPFSLALVPTFNACVVPTRKHLGGITSNSCNPVVQTSSVLTMGTPDVNGFVANFNGSLRYDAIVGVPTTDADEADVRITVNLTDIRNKPANTDYVGRVLLSHTLQIVDTHNSVENPEPGTTVTIPYSYPVDCIGTLDTAIGSSCTLNTTADAVIPNTVSENKRTIWEIGQVTVKDAGPNGTGYAACPPTCGDGDEAVFLRQGVFLP
jgi:hypothetical protein